MSTSISEFQHLGTGVWLYFSWLRGLAVCLAVLSIFHIPAMLLCSSGEGTAEDDRDSFGIWRYTLGNVGAVEIFWNAAQEQGSFAALEMALQERFGEYQ